MHRLCCAIAWKRKGSRIRISRILGFAAKSIARMLLPYNIEITQALANGIRGYKNKVRLRGLTKIKGFETCVVRYAQRKRDRQVSFV